MAGREETQRPITGMIMGITVGLMLGVAAVYWFDLSGSLEIFCVTAISILCAQLFGSLAGATTGRIHLPGHPNSQINQADDKSDT